MRPAPLAASRKPANSGGVTKSSAVMRAVRYPLNELSTPVAVPQADQQKRPVAAHLQAVAPHHVEVGADVRGQVDLVDDEQIAAADARARPCAGSCRPRPRR